MRTNLENPRISEARLTGVRHSNVVTVLTGTLVIPADGPTVWVLDGGASDRAIRLPELHNDKQIVIANIGNTNLLNITDSVGVALVTMPAQSLGIFFAGTTRWIWSVGGFSTSGVTTTVLTGSAALLSSDIEVQVNSAGAAVVTLPTAAAWTSSSGARGFPLSIFDISGNASVNNITINPSGGDTISGLASLTIADNYGGWRLRPKSGGGWIVV